MIVSSEQLLVLRLYVPSPNAVNLKINPPDTWHAEDEPQTRFLAQRPDR